MINGAKKYISGLKGSFRKNLLQIRSNDLENSSADAVNKGITEVVATLKTKFPEAVVMVSGISPRWKPLPVEGMKYKSKKTELN